MAESDIRWHTTLDEMNFIDKLGSLTQFGTPRIVLLRNYLQAMKMRDRWEDINPYQIKVYVQEAIKTEEMAFKSGRK